jgi:GNAT superfamily N-acetyltransferase
MALPIIDHRHPTSAADLVRLFHQTEERWTEHLAHAAPLDVGTAYANPALLAVHDANNIRDAALPDNITPAAAIDSVLSHYAQQNTRCAYWVMNPSAPEHATKPLTDHLLSIGYRTRAADILLLSHAPPVRIPESPALKIIPARASFRHTRILAEQSAAAWNTPQLADAWMTHLDDPHWDALLALKEGHPAAYVGVLAVGEVGRIDDVYVAPAFRNQGIAQTMLARILEICARALFRHVMLSTLADNTPAHRLYQKLGFKTVGQLIAYCPP